MGHIFDTVDILASIDECLEQRVKILTDGSGGKRTKDKRLRRCGWGWVIQVEGSEKVAKYGARGALGRVQTMPRAELRAIHQCLSSLKKYARIRHVTIYSDCKMAVDCMRKGRQHTSLTQLGQL